MKAAAGTGKEGNAEVVDSKTAFMLQKEGKKKDGGDKDANKEEEDSGK